MIELRDRRIVDRRTPTMIMAGEVHYFRVARTEWADRMDKLAEIGCRCVASYIPWLFHELPDGTFDLTGRTRPERDLGAFIDLCAERGLTFFARPGPFIMAELKNEGLPYRLYTDHPEISPSAGTPPPHRRARSTTWPSLPGRGRALVRRGDADPGRPAATAGGPVIGVQLDNEIGMLAWVSNSPDLTDGLVADLGAGAASATARVSPSGIRSPLTIRPPGPRRSGRRTSAGRQRCALTWAGSCATGSPATSTVLADAARRYGVTEVPFLINIHGTEGGNGVPFAIGVSQLFQTYAGRPGFAAGSDHYLGNMSSAVTTDIHFINAAMAAMNSADQPLTSLEFEAGTGDYSGGLDGLYDPSTVDLKTRLCVAQGNRMINYYLLAGGINPPLDRAVGDGNDRISFTGERHGTAAPIGPRGERGLTFAATAGVTHAIEANSRWLADQDEELDDLTVGFWPDAFMTEYHYPGSADHDRRGRRSGLHRGPGPRKSLWRSLLLAGLPVQCEQPAGSSACRCRTRLR